MYNFLEKDVELIERILDKISNKKINITDIENIIKIYNLFICSNKQYLYNRTYITENLKIFLGNIEKIIHKRDMIYKLVEKINEDIINIKKSIEDVYVILDKFYILSSNLKFKINLYEDDKFSRIKELIDTNLYNIDSKLDIKIIKYDDSSKSINTIFIKEENLNDENIYELKNLIINELKEL